MRTPSSDAGKFGNDNSRWGVWSVRGPTVNPQPKMSSTEREIMSPAIEIENRNLLNNSAFIPAKANGIFEKRSAKSWEL